MSVVVRAPVFQSARGQASQGEVEPVAEFRQGVSRRKVVVESPRDRGQKLAERLQTRRKLAGEARGPAAHDFEHVTEISEQPATTNARAVTKARLYVAALCHLCKHRGEVCARVDGERQRIPE